MQNPFAPDLLSGQHIVVTGGGSGLGRAMAETLAGLGATVTVCGRRPEPLSDTVAAITAAGNRAFSATCDVRDPDAVAAFYDVAEAQGGPVTGLVNNAAGNILAPTAELSANAFKAVVETVLHGAFYHTTACGRRWIERGTPGAVVSIVTTYTHTGSAFVIPSACAKAGVEAMMRSLAVEWATYGIRLNCVAPGPFPTEGASSRLLPTAELQAAALRRVPLGRFGEPVELANTVAFLLSDASGYTTGATLTVDGGEWLASGGQFNDYAKADRASVLGLMRQLKPSKR